MFLKKFLSQPNVVGSVLIALLICAGIVYAFGFNGFNVQTATNGNVDAWLAQTASEGCGGTDDCGSKCTVDGEADKCQGNGCTFKCKNKPTPRSLPTTGAEPNSTQEMRKICSGDLHRIRTYNENGVVVQDEDHDAPHGDHGIPHIHLWVIDEDGIPRRNEEPEDQYRVR